MKNGIVELSSEELDRRQQEWEQELKEVPSAACCNATDNIYGQ